MKQGTYTHTDGRDYEVLPDNGEMCTGCYFEADAGCRDSIPGGCSGVIFKEITMAAKNEKKIRQILRRTQNEIVVGAQQAVPHAAMQAVLAMRTWSFRDRFKFARWLLFGRGPWGGV